MTQPMEEYGTRNSYKYELLLSNLHHKVGCYRQEYPLLHHAEQFDLMSLHSLCHT